MKHLRLTVASSTLALASLSAACSSNEPSETADGATVYAENCASCHGADLRGTAQGPSQLSIVYEPNHHSDDSYRAAIRNGAPQHHWAFGNMPAIQGITDDEIELVIQFIRQQQETLGFEY